MSNQHPPPAGPISFKFETYANNVRVVPPLVGPWQLGTARLKGNGVISNGNVTGTFDCTDNIRGGPRPGVRRISGRIIDGTYSDFGNARSLVLTVEITRTSHPREECAVGLTGTLELLDSQELLPNRKSKDFVRLSGWNGVCNTHVHGWNNTDPGPRAQPPTGGPPNGGQWARVEIGG